MMENKRSIGVTIFGYLHIIGGTLGVILNVLAIWKAFSSNTSQVFMSCFEDMFYPLPFNPWFYILTIPTTALSTLSIIIGNGLLKLKEWARKWAIYLAVFDIIFGSVYYFAKGSIIKVIVRLITSIVTIFYFTHSKVKGQFSVEPEKVEPKETRGMVKYFNKAVILISIIIIIFLINIALRQYTIWAEQEFKRIITALNKARLEHQDSEWFKSIDKLRGFVINYRYGKYSDDAAYITAKFSAGNYRVERLRSFIRYYPNASLESWTLETTPFIDFEKKLDVRSVAKIYLIEELYFLKRYDESINEARVFIDKFDMEKLTNANYDILSLAYQYLITSYEKLSNYKKAKEICAEAIVKFPDGKEEFIKKLKELDSISK